MLAAATSAPQGGLLAGLVLKAAGSARPTQQLDNRVVLSSSWWSGIVTQAAPSGMATTRA